MCFFGESCKFSVNLDEIVSELETFGNATNLLLHKKVFIFFQSSFYWLSSSRNARLVLAFSYVSQTLIGRDEEQHGLRMRITEYTSAQIPHRERLVTNGFLLSIHFLDLFPRLVLGCINVDFCVRGLVWTQKLYIFFLCTIAEFCDFSSLRTIFCIMSPCCADFPKRQQMFWI